ncbi:MAG: prepilin peptidase [Candidatus Nanohaloarchaea archaeon]|nr:prepilin peptidase [Candidatus Nanohaloarchaea archaeon]
MLEHLFAAFVLGGTSYAAYLDLKTTEVPDSVSLVIGGGALLFHGYLSLSSGSLQPLSSSILSGASLFLLGWSMYIAGMWGGADAFVLGSVGFALPALSSFYQPLYPAPWPMMLSLLMTVFMLGAAYSLGYAVYLSFISEDFLEELRQEFEERRRGYSRAVILYVLMAGAGTLAVYTLFNPSLRLVIRNLAASVVLLASLLALSLFLRTVESRLLTHEVPVEKLEEGDVLGEDLGLEESRDDPVEGLTDRLVEGMISFLPFDVSSFHGSSDRIAGLTQEQVEELQDRSDTEAVEVKTGVRFVPVFPAALLLLLTLGDPVYFLMLQAL